MDILNLNLRRPDFEAMHPVAKLLSFDSETLIYIGDKSESINSCWSTWCACIGMVCLETEGINSNVVPEGFVLVPRQPSEKTLIKMSWSVVLGEDQYGNSVYLSIDEAKAAYEAVIEAQEQGHEK